ncbi:DNA polymerase III subunit delta' [Marinitenerispora sediminis]|uniref:DNA polymerase III subunit delta n=1 Tax=Marinitenerispora sediminis TaxID=1931232 RepID=A0A368T4S9_9ACTN|nr:DNA polymerase III subunit delta' [Marinitenerispora sediminis]RCV51413.1 DNA polymerase III subunit delta' [Marinitenerispora sediminis]RCV57228.1 DNA polymerase III subunit delta' [Marinitenerispora sediminis]RCV58581.1 DNA polymerase III subunit delta' [Marinitenerispora sediminis]
MSVFDDLVGQDTVIEQLRSAARAADGLLAGGTGAGMTHAWLFTGPPGSGRAVAARAFAAALQCAHGGCGHCDSCHQVLTGTHADVLYVRPTGLSFGVERTRDLVLRAASSPTGGRFRVVLFEDADRATEAASNALLKAVEEPSPRTVWLLCTPTAEDLLVTIRSRCRLVLMRTPGTPAVVDALVRRDGVDPGLAGAVARAAAGDVERARRLAADPEARERRREVLSMPARLDGLGACVSAAARLYELAEAEAKQTTAALDEQEKADMRAAFGEGATGKGVAKAVRGAAGALKELEERQKRRATRIKRDTYDVALMDLAAFYRDVLAVQLGAQVQRSTESHDEDVRRVAGSSTPEATLRRVDAIMRCRERIAANVHPQIAIEAMTAALYLG